MDQRAYSVGATAIVLAPGATALKITPTAFQLGWRLTVSGGGSSGVAIVNTYGITASAGYLIPSTGVEICGPAEFFLVAQGTTAIVGALMLRGAGYSAPIG